MAAFCTTDPPGNSRILPYTQTGAYIVLLVSIGFSIGGLIVGSAAVFVIHKSTAEWFRKVRHLSIRGCRDDMWQSVHYRLGGTVPIVEVADGIK